MSTTAALLDWAAGHWDAADERARHELVDRGCTRGVIGSLDVIGLVAMGRTGRRGSPLARGVARDRAPDRRGPVRPDPALGPRRDRSADRRPEAARVRCEEALALAVETGERALLIPFVVTGTRALIAARRPNDAEPWVARFREHLDGWEPVAGAALNHADGLIRLVAGSLSSAREALERAVRGWEERGRIWEATWAQLDLAQCLIRMNRHGDAIGLLTEVQREASHSAASRFWRAPRSWGARVADEAASMSRGGR